MIQPLIERSDEGRHAQRHAASFDWQPAKTAKDGRVDECDPSKKAVSPKRHVMGDMRWADLADDHGGECARPRYAERMKESSSAVGETMNISIPPLPISPHVLDRHTFVFDHASLIEIFSCFSMFGICAATPAWLPAQSILPSTPHTG